jgi:hypothetical protein
MCRREALDLDASAGAFTTKPGGMGVKRRRPSETHSTAWLVRQDSNLCIPGVRNTITAPSDQHPWKYLGAVK